ncbi:hypothetical protein L2E82_26031 [Cichorium intybus]|uniref:Uncharacterized protein n=1 Tax=Cichorium intybus TaxID=13427 RepID=A0ACB9E5M2_CICIN|nr:hypothetical protein L2E82_26031 [Cichorium intybus]
MKSISSPIDVEGDEDTGVCLPQYHQKAIPRKAAGPMVVFFSTMLTHRGLPGNLKPKERKSDRIVFKLFGKDPNELPVLLRNQILNWLSQSPTDIEGYINAGCIILSLCYDLGSNLRRLLEAYNDSFWRTGWIYTRVLDHVAFACDG